MASESGYSEAVWSRFAELGLLALPFDPELGGIGGGGVELMLVMEQLGHGLVVEPYLPTVVLGGTALEHGLRGTARAEAIGALAEGRLKLAWAHAEARGRYAETWVETTARRDGTGYVLDGKKAVVVHGAAADRLVVSARTSGAAADRDGITLFLVDRTAKGVRLLPYRTIDGQRAAEVTLERVNVGADAVLGEVGRGADLIARILDRGAAALCAEAVGAMTALQEATLEYLKTRQQFGQPIGRFQALQHRMVDMLINLEQARSLAILAAVKSDSEDARERARAVSAAKSGIGRYGRFLGQQAIQLHGGMGMTDELVVGHWFKRLTIIDALLGDQDHHLARFVAHGAAG